MIVTFCKKLLFQLDPEQAHHAALSGLKVCQWLGLSSLFSKSISNQRQLMGLTFSNPVGLAAGFDKNADYIDALAALGFGFIEVGTLTPKPQVGNPRPRLFRLTEHEAIINRMGFNNKGVEHAVRQLEKTKYRGVLGINIGKNKDTPQEKAVDDYIFGFKQLWKFASYITINISSPNTPGLRDLQQSDSLRELLAALKQEQHAVAATKYVPLVVKISPDLSDTEIQDIAAIFLELHIDGVIATNTTIARDSIQDSPYANETGGLSGKPLMHRGTAVIRKLHSILGDKIPIIASGGVMDAQAAREKMEAGAKLVQVYTGFIFRGPSIIREVGWAPIKPNSKKMDYVKGE